MVELIAAHWKWSKSYYRKDGKPTTELSTVKSTLKPLKTLYGDTLAFDFGPLALKAVWQTFIDDGCARK